MATLALSDAVVSAVHERGAGSFAIADRRAATMMTSTRSKLRIRGGPYDGCGLSLIGGVTTIGREATNDTVVEQPVVSRKHAMIFYNAPGFWLQDLGSQNGTFVDGQRVGQQPRALKHGERIQLGSAESGTVWEYNEVHEADLGLQSPATLQIPIGPAALPQAPAAPVQPAVSAQPGAPGYPGVPAQNGAPAPAEVPAQQEISGGPDDPASADWPPCRAFTKNADESWTCEYFVSFEAGGQQIEVSRGTTFVSGPGFLGLDVTEFLEQNCSGRSFR